MIWVWQPMERVTGIGPARPAWKAGVLPLNYTRILRGTVGRPWNGGERLTHQWEMYRYGGGDPVAWCGHLELNQDGKGHSILWLYL